MLNMNVFCHANGFPPNSYDELLSKLSSVPLNLELAPLKRPFTDHERRKNWHHFGDEMIDDLKLLSPAPSSIVGIGHSMGAVMLLRAAVKHPNWFKKLVLIDPTFLPEAFVYASNYLPRFINRKIHPVGAKAFRRRDCWASKQEAYNSFRGKRLFRELSDQALWNYVNSAIAENKQGEARLTYSKQWEEHCFLSVINIWPLLKKCSVPIVGITGARSELMRPKIITRWKKAHGSSEIHTLKAAGHLVPLERPSESADIINQHLD